MNTLCSNILKDFLKENQDRHLKILVHNILTFGQPLKNLTLDYLREHAQDVPPAEAGRPDAVEPQIQTTDGVIPAKSDYRIEKLTFHHFRTYPKDGRQPFGLSFMKKGNVEPCSLFLVGKNGTGKSTIFDALEWIYAGKVRNAEDRGIEEQEKLSEYLTYGFGKIEGVTPDIVRLCVKLHGEDRKEWGLNTTEPLCVPAICCSDMDIEEIAKMDDDTPVPNRPTQQGDNMTMHRFVNNQLGFEELTDLREKLVSFAEPLEVSNRNLERRRELLNLTGDDLRGIQQLLKDITYSMDEGEQKGVLKFASRKRIVQFSGYQNPPQALSGVSYPFIELWRELIRNVQLKKSLEERGGAAFLPEAMQEVPAISPQEIDGQINAYVDQIEAIHKRLKVEWESIQDVEVENRYNKAILRLEDDAVFLETDGRDLPVRSEDIRKMKGVNQRIAESSLKLGAYLTTVQSHLLQVRKNRDGVAEEYVVKYPDKLNDFVKKVLNYYCEQGEVFDVKSTANSFDVKISVTDKQGRTFTTTPRKYLNTFRFRLYAVLLKIALAFFYMKENNCLAPIVIDDVFNASDFENSVSLSTFVSKIYEVYQEVIDSSKPLQLVILTHDEMVVNAFQRGVKMKTAKVIESIENRKIMDPENYFIQGRLFHFTEATDIEKKLKVKRPFLNLYLPLGR